jgi:hypothetical protein
MGILNVPALKDMSQTRSVDAHVSLMLFIGDDITTIQTNNNYNFLFRVISIFPCTVCNPNSFKQQVSNSKCIKCPPRRMSTWNRTSCRCEDGLYSPRDVNNSSPCYGEITTIPTCNFCPYRSDLY